jgi:hypothetical protein
MALERIYKITITMGDKKRTAMVKASSASQATRHMLKDMVEVKPASSTQVAEHMEKGGTIQNTQPVETPAETQV